MRAATSYLVTEVRCPGVSRELRRDLDMRDPGAVALLAKNIFVFGQCM